MPSEIRNVISRLEEDNQKLDRYISQYKECVRELHSYVKCDLTFNWEGGAAEAYSDHLLSLVQEFGDCSFFYDDLSEIQKDAIEEYTNAENATQIAIQNIDI